MEHAAPPGLQRPGYGRANANYQRPPPNTLADDMQNLQTARPGPPSMVGGPSIPRPPPFASHPFSANSSTPSSVPRPVDPSPSSYRSDSSVSCPGPLSTGFPSGTLSIAFLTHSTQAPNLAPGRPSGPPASHPAPTGSRCFPTPFSSAHLTSVPTFGQLNAHGPLMNGPPSFPVGNMSRAPPSSLRSSQQPPPGPPMGPLSRRKRPFPESPHYSAPSRHTGQPLPPSSAASQVPMAGPPMRQIQSPQGPSVHGSMQLPRMPPSFPSQSRPKAHLPVVGGRLAEASNTDTIIRRPYPASYGSSITYETRQSGQASVPPPATSDYIARDTGNCSPRYMRCTMNQIPCTGDLLSSSCMELALMVQPLALPHPSEEKIRLVDFGEGGPVCCSCCKCYMNPFMKFVDQGRCFICNLCGFTNETPREYHCNLGPDGRRKDADERPELCKGTVEFVATKEYMGRDPMPAVFFFLVDVSRNAIQTGATAAACTAINQAIAYLPGGPRTMVGFATFDSSIHFYNLKRVLEQPSMLIVPAVGDIYAPPKSDVIVQLTECRQRLEQLLENIPTMFKSSLVVQSAFGAATKAAFLAMKSTGGKLLVFQSVLPSVGFGALSARDSEGRMDESAGDKEVKKLLMLQPADEKLTSMAIEFAEYQVCVDIFITSQMYVDIASLSVVPNTTGGRVYYYYPFSAISDSRKLYNDLIWNVIRPQGFEAVMHVRCSQGLQVHDYSGSFHKRIPTAVDLPAIDCDKTIMVTFKHNDKLVDGSECGFQCALLYTTKYGERRIRVTTLSLPCTSVLDHLFHTADLDAYITYFLKQAAKWIPAYPIRQVQELVMDKCFDILASYFKSFHSVASSRQLILPEALKLLPLYTQALLKSIDRTSDARIDDQAYWINHVRSIPVPLAAPILYPRMMAIHNLLSEEVADTVTPILLSSKHLSEDGIYLLESGEDGFIYVGMEASSDSLQQIFGVASIGKLPKQFVLQQFDNELSRKVNLLVNEIRRQRYSYLRLRLCKKGDPSEKLFFSYMVQDDGPVGFSEFARHLVICICKKMA